MRKRTLIIGIISAILFVTGVFFKLWRFKGASILIITGLVLFVCGFMLLLFVDKVSIESRRNARISLFLLLLIVAFTFCFGLFKIFNWEISSYLGYATITMIMLFFLFFASQLESRKLTIRKNRQLASILFTDIAGYTALMGNNETETLEELTTNHRIQKRLIRKYRGKWLKEAGDGLMAVFYTASEAVLCAIEIQNEVGSKTSLKVRIGIHVSEIVFTDKDIFGDGVNVASRIADKAATGEIWFSDTVYYNIRNREKLDIVNIGDTELKNVSYKLNLYKVHYQSSPALHK